MEKEKEIDRIATFQHELNLMQSDGVRRLTEKCLRAAPGYFFTDSPSSSSGKYHPKDEHCGLGTVLHSKRVAYMARELASAMCCEQYLDELTAAAILHDCVKYGWQKGRHTVKEHPELAASLLADSYKDDRSILDRERAIVIYNAVKYHTGKWGTGSMLKPIEMYSTYEMCIHLADVAASRNDVFINVPI